jgi:hypothetical protein
MSYTCLAVAGVGISLCFPTVANAVVGSVPAANMGIASGTNSALREIGGVFGIAILASVFADPGNYTSAHTFVNKFQERCMARRRVLRDRDHRRDRSSSPQAAGTRTEPE